MKTKLATAVITAVAAVIAICGSTATAVPAQAAKQTLESRVVYGLQVGECANVYTGPSISVYPPRLWATYDTTGRVGQKVAFQSRLYRLDANNQWQLIEKRPWQFDYARNQAPRGFDPGNLVTYINGAWIFTGAEVGSNPFQFHETTYFIKQTGRYRVAVDMYWYANAYSKASLISKWQPLRQELSGDAPPFLNCDFTN